MCIHRRVQFTARPTSHILKNIHNRFSFSSSIHMLRTIFGKKEDSDRSSSSTTMAATITQTEFKEALGRYPEILKAHGKTPKDASTTIEELDKFRYQIAPMNFSKNTGRIMELSDVEKLVQWKIHHGAFRPILPKLVASNTNELVAEATKDAFAAYANNNKDIATVISKLTTPLKGIGPATASLLLAVHDPQNVVFFSDELFSYLTADGKKVEPKYNTKEFETMFAEAQTVMSRLHCTPIELEKAAYVLIKEKAPEVKAAAPSSGKPRGRPVLSEAEKKAAKSRREAAKAKAAKAVTNRTRTGRIVKKTPFLLNETGTATVTKKARGRGRPADKVASAAKPAKKRGRPAGTAVKAAPKAKAATTKKAGRPAGTKVTSSTTKKAGRPAGTKVAASTPKKRGRPAAAASGTTPAKKAGRPAKAEAVEAKTVTPKKRGRPSLAAEAVTATPASKKRGRPSLAAAAETSTPASKKRKTTATPAPASSAKRGGKTPASAVSSVKRSGRKAKA